MTGFGSGEAPLGGGRVVIEIRGVNHRFLDVRVRVGRELADLAPFVEGLVRERMARGRYDVGVRGEHAVTLAPALDKARAREAYKALCELRDELDPGGPVPLALLASVPDLFGRPIDGEIDEAKAAARAAFDAALRSLDEMRQKEGGALASDLARRLTFVRALARSIAERAPEITEAHRKRLSERVDRMRISGLVVDTARIETEVALLADRSDVTEELVRLESHCEQLEALFASPEPVGRRLDFLLQEMAREANTVSSKSPDAPVAHAVVEMKAEIERMREQVQNIE
jgi:uncharacterized protein (TIGR00255 family)